MCSQISNPSRFIGLDIHKNYFVAVGVDPELNQVFGPQKARMVSLDNWIRKHLSKKDAVVIEMTTNTWEVHDRLAPHVHSVTVVHPPHVSLITRAMVKTDARASLNLAQLLAAGLLKGIWVPPQEVRDLRALVAQRDKMVRLAIQAKNRLHSVLHRYAIKLPDGSPFCEDNRQWWQDLGFSQMEHVLIQSNLNTLDFAQQQIKSLEDEFTRFAAQDDRVPLLIQLPGFSLINSIAVLAAIGEIERFPKAKKLVGYAGLGSRVHISGNTHRTGRISKTGRRDLRVSLILAAQTAANHHPHWKAELNRLKPKLGHNKAITAIARKLLITIWHVLTNQEADRHCNEQMVARALMNHAWRLGKTNRPGGQKASQYVRDQLDRLGIGTGMTAIPWGTKKPPLALPPSRMNTGQ